MAGYTLSVTMSSPDINAVNVSRRSEIAITFNRDVDITSLSGNILLHQKTQDNTFDLVAGSISYSNKTVRFTPTTPLLANTVYRVTVIGDSDMVDGSVTGILDIFGNGMIGVYQYVFTTSNETILAKPVIINPADNSIVGSPVVIRWDAIPSALSYVIKLSPASDFSADLWETTISDPGATSVTPNITLVNGTYHCRIQYSTVEGLSPWSDTIRFYYEEYAQSGTAPVTDDEPPTEDDEDVTRHFSTIYTPLYASYEDVLLDIYPIAGGVDPELIYKSIRDASIEARELRTLVEAEMIGAIPTDWDNIEELPFYIKQYVRYKAGYDAFLHSYMIKASSIGEMVQLGDFLVQSNAQVSQDVARILSELKARIAPWLDQLMNKGFNRGFAKPSSATKGEESNPYQSYHTRSTFTELVR